MDLAALRALCLQQPGAYEDFPFGPEPCCIKVCGHIFAELYPSRDWVTLKCDKTLARYYREAYPDAVARGYHCPPVMQPTRNTVALHRSVPDDELRRMALHSYDEVVRKLPKYQQRSLQQERQEIP